MTSIGESLRRERLRRNLQLQQVSDELKISARMLAAIEAEDFEKLPGGVFARSFVRQYARLMGLDEDEMASSLDRALRPEQPAESPKHDARHEASAIPLPRMEAWQSVGDSRNRAARWSSSLPALMLVVVVMLICSGVYAFWQRPRRVVATNQTATAQRAAHPPSGQDAGAAPASTPGQNMTQQPPASQPAGQPPAQADSSPTPLEATTPAPKPEPAGPVAAPESLAAPRGAVHVEITATEPVWVRAVSDGKYVFSATMETNQSRIVDANESVLLRLGNAGGVNIVLNGKPLESVGPRGQIRNVQLTSGGFQIVAPPKSPAPAEPL